MPVAASGSNPRSSLSSRSSAPGRSWLWSTKSSGFWNKPRFLPTKGPRKVQDLKITRRLTQPHMARRAGRRMFARSISSTRSGRSSRLPLVRAWRWCRSGSPHPGESGSGRRGWSRPCGIFEYQRERVAVRSDSDCPARESPGIVNPDFFSGMQVAPGLGKDRRHVASGISRLPTKAFQ